MFFLIIEIITVFAFGYLLCKHRHFISKSYKNHENQLRKMLKKKSEKKTFKLLTMLGKDHREAEQWWNRSWHQFLFLSVFSMLVAIWTGSIGCMITPLLFILFQYYLLFVKIRERKETILKRIPFVLDMLILNLESGLDFVASLEELVRMNDLHPLHEEIKITLQNIQLGETRYQAFLNMADRTQIQELSGLAMMIGQSETMGSSLTELLRLQSQEIRHRIFKIAEGKAQKAPVQILIPMLLFIFPVVFIILFVPIGMQLFQSFY